MDTILWTLGAAVLIQVIVVRWICVAVLANKWSRFFPLALIAALVSGTLVLFLMPVYGHPSPSQRIIDDVVSATWALIGSLVVVLVLCLLVRRKWNRAKT
jgi:membrane protein DedA with SNARE-associated domain